MSHRQTRQRQESLRPALDRFASVRSCLARWLALVAVLVFARVNCASAQSAEAATAKASISCDVAVIGGSPSGIACAVRAAREGASVLLVNRHGHLGGMLSSGLGVWDTQYEGSRSPIYNELRAALMEYYREAYGDDSPQYRDARPGKTGYTNGRFEPHVAEKIISDMVAAESNIRVLTGFVPTSAARDGTLLKSVVLSSTEGNNEVTVTARIFVDSMYEGDLLALAKVPYRVGRESRAEFGEPHAGVIFMKPTSIAPDEGAEKLAKLHDQLNLRKFPGWQVLLPQSTGAADPEVQACNYRTMLTTNPDNRAPVPKPEDYAPYYLKALEVFSGVKDVPNDKFSWNRPQIIGRQTDYVEGDWAIRQRVMDEHWETTLGLLYFLQHDPTVPESVRQGWLEIGLAKDEFADNGYRPYEMYVRETRRLIGRSVYTQHDAMLAADLGRAPIHGDSIAMTEWYMDSHTCSLARVAGGMEEGKAMLHYETFPGQIPYRCLLPQGVDNLLVPLCLSATHVSWGTVRLEPVFLQTGEAAGLAAAMSLQQRINPAQLDSRALVRRLSILRSMVTFYNDVDASGDADWISSALFFGTQGFVHDYNLRAAEPLKEATARIWIEGVQQLRSKTLDPMEQARKVSQSELVETRPITRGEFAALLPELDRGRIGDLSATMTRGEVLKRLFDMLQ